MIRPFIKGAKEKLSPHFHSGEFDCRCTNPDCHTTYVDDELIEALEAFRALRGWPVRILSGYRCFSHNRKVGGKKDSFHCLAMAADIASDSPVRDADIARKVKQFAEGGIGCYVSKGFIHLDVRKKIARWLEP